MARDNENIPKLRNSPFPLKILRSKSSFVRPIVNLDKASTMAFRMSDMGLEPSQVTSCSLAYYQSPDITIFIPHSYARRVCINQRCIAKTEGVEWRSATGTAFTGNVVICIYKKLIKLKVSFQLHFTIMSRSSSLVMGLDAWKQLKQIMAFVKSWSLSCTKQRQGV